MPDRYANATLDCDIVMKGGITSGVVYPGAVLSLAEHYRFKSIGGASAGGIAAAIVAAAEHARHDRGFTKLAALPGELASEVDGRPFMLQLFQADRETRPLFNVMIGFLRGKRAGVAALLRSFSLFVAIAAVVAIVPLVLCLAAGAEPALAVGGVFAATLIAVGGVLAQAAGIIFKKLPANDFGLCRLGPDEKRPPALTDWLHTRIQDTAGLAPGAPPLTFADLKAGPGQVDLQMMTTDLGHGRPMRLPAPPDHDAMSEDGPRLLFKPEELEKFFPQEVVRHLEKRAPALSEAQAAVVEDLGLAGFPSGPDLPVVVATRMTLSFPVLISAVPLYELVERDGTFSVARLLFSDGGITSNFPVHFFDTPLPRRPTFGLNLTGFEPGEKPDPTAPCKAVRPPALPTEDAYAEIKPIGDVFGFFVAIKDAMQNWRDNAQSRLPGYRDRIVSLKLGPGEGGLNLTMDATKVAELNARGACAGDELVKLFTTQPHPQQWNQHRFVRYRTSMALIERLFKSYSTGYGADPDAVTQTYEELVAEGGPEKYELTPEARTFAAGTTEAYVDLVAKWTADGKTLDDERVPRPPSTLRAVPPV